MVEKQNTSCHSEHSEESTKQRKQACRCFVPQHDNAGFFLILTF